MTYSPGSPGYPPAQQQPSGYPAAAPAATPDFAKEPVESKLPQYLTYAVVGFGLAAYFASYGPMFGLTSDIAGGGHFAGGGQSVVALLLAALLAGVGLLPKAKSYLPVATVISVLGLLLAISETVNTTSGVSAQWGMYLVLAFALFQSVTAVAALLLEAGVITPPVPKPKFDPYQQQYGQYGQYPQQQYGQQQPYYGQHAAQAQPGHQAPPGYGSQQYGGYGPGPSQAQAPNQSNIPTQNAISTSVANQASGGYGAQPSSHSGPQPTVVTGSQHSGPQPTMVTGSQPSAPAPTMQTPTTPPTGFPSYGAPPSSSAGGGDQAGSAPANYSTPSSNQTQTYGQGQQSPGSAPV
jgi:Family of unknown function (DUF5336)